MTRMVAISGLGRLGSGGLAANPGEYPPALRSTLPGAVMKATVAPETGVHLGNIGRGGGEAPRASIRADASLTLEVQSVIAARAKVRHILYEE